MKRFQFTLEAVLQFKRQRERMAELRVMQLKSEVDRAKQRMGEIEQQLARLSEQMARAAESPGGSWLAQVELSSRVGQSLQDAIAVLEQAMQRHADAVKERSRWAGEVEALQKLREQQWQEYRRESQRDEVDRLDEFSMRGWQPPTE